MNLFDFIDNTIENSLKEFVTKIEIQFNIKIMMIFNQKTKSYCILKPKNILEKIKEKRETLVFRSLGIKDIGVLLNHGNLVVNTKKKIVIGKLEKENILPLSLNDIDLCKSLGLEYCIILNNKNINIKNVK